MVKCNLGFLVLWSFLRIGFFNMRTILSLFGKSPFKPMAHHMDKVKSCVDQIEPLFEALIEKDYSKVSDVSELIQRLEHDADKIKDGIRSHLANSIFLPVDKRDFMRLLSAQDDIADSIEDLGFLLRVKDLKTPTELKAPLEELVKHVVKTAHMACDLIYELDTLVESSFGGLEAEKVEKAADSLGTEEWEADKKQFALAKVLFSMDDKLNAADLLLWNETIKKLGVIADKSETIGKILRSFLAN